jgi:predicted ATPase
LWNGSAASHTRGYAISARRTTRTARFIQAFAQLERAAGLRREDTSEQRLAKLEAVLAQGTNDLSEVIPLLADLLSIPTGDRYLPLTLTPQKRKEKTLHVLLAQLEGLAARQRENTGQPASLALRNEPLLPCMARWIAH